MYTVEKSQKGLNMFKRYIENFFLVNLKDYSNIGFDLYINVIIFALFLGMCVSVFIVFAKKAAMVSAIKQLLRREAFGEENAKTLKELGLLESNAVRRAMSRDGQLKRIVSRVGEIKYTYEEYLALIKAKKLQKERINFDQARFFIKETEINRARSFYERFSPSVIRTAGFALLLLVLYVCTSLVVPEILAWINTLLA